MIEIHFVSTKCFINTSDPERLQLRASDSIWISVYPGHTGPCSICKYFMFHTIRFTASPALVDADWDLAIGEDWETRTSQEWFGVIYYLQTAPPIYRFSVFPCSEEKMKLPLWLSTDHRDGRFMGGCSPQRKAHALHLALWAHQPFISQYAASPPTPPPLPRKTGAKQEDGQRLAFPGKTQAGQCRCCSLYLLP